jgi:hypothetical protein
MPNRFTRVPERPVPALPRPGRLLLPIADLFMLLMISRPHTGSLRTTWVTPATLGLSAATAFVGTLLEVAMLRGGPTMPTLMGAAAVAVLAAGSASVAVIGLLQRR